MNTLKLCIRGKIFYLHVLGYDGMRNNTMIESDGKKVPKTIISAAAPY